MENSTQYFCYLNGKKVGPLSKELLYKLNIQRDTLVWRNGLQNWVAAGSLPELLDLFIGIPPKIPEIPKETPMSKFAKTVKVFAIFGIIVAAIMNLLSLLGYYNNLFKSIFFVVSLWLLAFSIIVLVKANITRNKYKNL